MTYINARLDYNRNWIKYATSETFTVPVSTVFRLAEIPNNTSIYNTSGANVAIAGFTEVFGTSPSLNQFRVHYVFGYIQFSSLNVGDSLTVDYDGIGTSVLAEDINGFVQQLLTGVAGNILTIDTNAQAQDSGVTFSTDDTLGGVLASDDFLPTQKAVRTYILTPTINDFTNAQHDHSDTANGGLANATVDTNVITTDLTSFSTEYLQDNVYSKWIDIANYNGKTLLFDTWSSESSLNNSRRGHGTFGTQNSAVVAGGYYINEFDATVILASTEIYNGNSWATDGSMDLNGVKSYIGACGTRNSAIVVGGYDNSTIQVTEEWNGLTFANMGAGAYYTVGIYGLSVVGTRYNAIGIGGYQVAIEQATEIWNGVAWSYSASYNMLVAKDYLGGAGTSTSALHFGGNTGSVSSECEKWNASAWSITTSLNLARKALSGCGTQNSAITINGQNGASPFGTAYSNVEKFNGTAWNNTTSSLYAVTGTATCGTQNASITTGGGNASQPVSVGNGVQKFYGEIPFKIDAYIKGTDNFLNLTSYDGVLNLNTFNEECDMMIDFVSDENTGLTFEERRDIISLDHLDWIDGVWTATASLPEARSWVAGSGIPNSALIFSGYNGSDIGTTSIFNGISWSNIGTGISVARSGSAGFGVSYASVCAGGADNKSYNFDGLTWTESGNLTYAPSASTGVGVLNAGVVFGGYDSGMVATTNTYDGATWSAGNDRILALQGSSGCGSRYNILAIGGNPMGPNDDDVEIYNGLSWSEAQSYPYVISQGSASGIVNSALSFGGNIGTNDQLLVSQYFNGYSWSTTAGMQTPRFSLAGNGSSSSALSFGGATGVSTNSAVTEKYNTQKSFPASANLKWNRR